MAKSETIYFQGIPYRRYPNAKRRSDKVYFQRSAYKKFGGKTGFLHREVWEYYNGKIPDGYLVHHIDGDSGNNDINNLELVLISEHAKRHNWGIWEGMQKHLDEIRLLTKKWHRSKKGRQWHRKMAKKLWENRTYYAKCCRVCGWQVNP